jgi:hypothetical protein
MQKGGVRYLNFGNFRFPETKKENMFFQPWKILPELNGLLLAEGFRVRQRFHEW